MPLVFFEAKVNSLSNYLKRFACTDNIRCRRATQYWVSQSDYAKRTHFQLEMIVSEHHCFCHVWY